jgi:hypothetical protein
MLGGYISDLGKGDVFKPVEYVITPFMCSEYAHGTEETSEYYHSARNPAGRQVRPPTMIHVDKMRILEGLKGSASPAWRPGCASPRIPRHTSPAASVRCRDRPSSTSTSARRGSVLSRPIDGRLIHVQRLTVPAGR